MCDYLMLLLLLCVQVYITLVLQWAGYWLLAVYLSNVLPNEVRGAASAIEQLVVDYESRF